MSENEKQVWYRDKKVEDCTREELIDAIYWLQKTREDEQRWRCEDREMERLFADASLPRAFKASSQEREP